MKRKIIHIDEEKCNGCGDCIPACPEGAIQIIDGKARLVSDLFCDGLGACLGTCPTGAISVEEREAEPYDEEKVMKEIMAKGENTIRAHLKHLREHGEVDLLQQALAVLKKNNYNIDIVNRHDEDKADQECTGGCPGSMAQTLREHSNEKADKSSEESGYERTDKSHLATWPVKLRLLNPKASYLKNADLLVAADCTAFASGGFHDEYLKGRVPVTFCPKLDEEIEEYVEKLAEIFRTQSINSVTIVRMEVPCCAGTEKIVESAMNKAGTTTTVRRDIIKTSGTIKHSETQYE